MNSVLDYRVPVGRKISGPERIAEARRLNDLLSAANSFSFIRMGDYDLSLLEDEAGFAPETWAWERTGTQARGSHGLDARYRDRLHLVLEQADFVDFSDLLWQPGAEFLDQYRSRARNTCTDRERSYILPTWVEQHFKHYCSGRRVLFCGSEAPILQHLCAKPSYLAACADYFELGENVFFLRPKADGRNLAQHLDEIKDDLRRVISQHRIETIFLSLGAGAKILCVELAKELGIHAIDFGAMMRALCYSGSDGNRAARATHSIYLFRVPFALHMDAVEQAFPELPPESILAKAHAQLLLEVQEKEVGWSHSAGESDLSASNVTNFRAGLMDYKQRYRHLFKHSAATRKERKDFLHFCGKNKLTWEGRVFYLLFLIKSQLTSALKIQRRNFQAGDVQRETA